MEQEQPQHSPSSQGSTELAKAPLGWPWAPQHGGGTSRTPCQPGGHKNTSQITPGAKGTGRGDSSGTRTRPQPSSGSVPTFPAALRFPQEQESLSPSVCFPFLSPTTHRHRFHGEIPSGQNIPGHEAKKIPGLDPGSLSCLAKNGNGSGTSFPCGNSLWTQFSWV